ncbi:MAG: hypothetical protein JWO27_3218 [Frankiales bacterium]|nr:hypothetical protein [Frankiales bacterium]
MRVLVLRALGLGDLLTAVPALRGLRRAHPTAHIQLACPRALGPIVSQVGAVDELVDAAPLQRLPTSVDGAALGVNLHGRGPQSTALLEATGPARLLAWGRDGRGWRPDEHEVVRWCRLLTESGIPCDTDDLLLPARGPRGSHVVVHPGAAKPSRRWPVQRWAEVVRGLDHAEVLVTAGPGEQQRATEVVRQAGQGRVLSPSLDGLCDLVATAALVVAPDTGVAHLATAYRTPSVLLFGPTSPAVWGPPDVNRHRVLWRGQVNDDDAPEPDPGLLELTPSDVLAAAR